MPNTTTSATKQLSDGNSVGTVLGKSATDKIGFYGINPGVVQPSGQGQIEVPRGAAGGSITTFNTATASPTGVDPNTTRENNISVLGSTAFWRITAGDMLYVNKPTAQAGLGVGNARVTATGGIGVTFSNFTAATVTPTASQSYGIVAIRGLTNYAAVLSPAAVPPTTIAEQQFAVAQLRDGQTVVQVIKPSSQTGLDIVGMRAVSPGVLGITFANVTAATITPTASESYTIFEVAGLDAITNTVAIQATLSPTATSNTVSAAEQGFTVTGLAVSDMVVGVQKPTAQANLGLVGWRVSAANSLGINFGNYAAATVTPTASEVYGIEIFRPAPAAPMVRYTPTLAPTSVAANTTAEQTFTVAGLVAGSMVWVNKPSWTSGLGIVGCRVSALNTLAITFANVTAAAIVPPAEVYTVANFQQPIPDASGSFTYNVSPTSQQQSILDNSLRSALVTTGLIAGA